MKNFLQLIEIARLGIVGVSHHGGPMRRVPATDEFWQYVEQCHPFVFSRSGETVDLKTEDMEDEYLRNIKLDAPFKVFSIEVLDGYVTIPREEDKDPAWIPCIMVVELEPQKYRYYTLCEYREKGRKGLMVFQGFSDGPIVEKFLERLKAEKTGVENTRVSVKIGAGDLKRNMRIRRIVHVAPKKDIEKIYKEEHKEVDWTHRWEVRGHWRKMDGLGKNREGDYCVNGFTWVSEHIKGNEDLPLVKKTRIVDSN